MQPIIKLDELKIQFLLKCVSVVGACQCQLHRYVAAYQKQFMCLYIRILYITTYCISVFVCSTAIISEQKLICKIITQLLWNTTRKLDVIDRTVPLLNLQKLFRLIQIFCKCSISFIHPSIHSSIHSFIHSFIGDHSFNI